MQHPHGNKPRVYIASPYSMGDPAMNTNFQCRVFNTLLDDGRCTPIAPLWTHFQHLLYPRPYEDWLRYDLELLPLYDACLRLNVEIPELRYSESESAGADREVARFKELGKPVFYGLNELFKWLDQFSSKDSPT